MRITRRLIIAIVIMSVATVIAIVVSMSKESPERSASQIPDYPLPPRDASWESTVGQVLVVNGIVLHRDDSSLAIQIRDRAPALLVAPPGLTRKLRTQSGEEVTLRARVTKEYTLHQFVAVEGQSQQDRFRSPYRLEVIELIGQD